MRAIKMLTRCVGTRLDGVLAESLRWCSRDGAVQGEARICLYQRWLGLRLCTNTKTLGQTRHSPDFFPFKTSNLNQSRIRVEKIS
jgi:hypothetical protein